MESRNNVNARVARSIRRLRIPISRCKSQNTFVGPHQSCGSSEALLSQTLYDVTSAGSWHSATPSLKSLSDVVAESSALRSVLTEHHAKIERHVVLETLHLTMTTQTSLLYLLINRHPFVSDSWSTCRPRNAQIIHCWCHCVVVALRRR